MSTHLFTTEFNEKSIGDKLDVLAHQFAIHSDQSARQCVRQELLLDINGLSNYVTNRLHWRFMHDMFEEQASKISVQTLK